MCSSSEPIDITIPGSPDDPRAQRSAPEGVAIRYAPELHADEVTTVEGIRLTTVARTLIDLAECMSRDELWDAFATARRKGLLDIDDVRASRSRVEWCPSLAMLDEVIAEFEH